MPGSLLVTIQANKTMKCEARPLWRLSLDEINPVSFFLVTVASTQICRAMVWRVHKLGKFWKDTVVPLSGKGQNHCLILVMKLVV